MVDPLLHDGSHDEGTDGEQKTSFSLLHGIRVFGLQSDANPTATVSTYFSRKSRVLVLL